RAEAAVIARLQHPNIVRIYDVGEAAGRPYFVLEFVAGGSLAQRLEGTPQPARLAAQLVETLARAVHVAHTSGVIHPDLQAANILLEGTGLAIPATGKPSPRREDGATLNSWPLTAKITDFGVAKCADGDGNGEGPEARGLTVTGELLGTPNYMAPEQAAGAR